MQGMLELPEPSVAVHVMVVTPIGYRSVNGKTSERTPVKVIVVKQLSIAVGLIILTFAEHCPGTVYCVISCGQVIIGGVLSMMVTVCVHGRLTFPEASVAVHMMEVTPIGNSALKGKPSERIPVKVMFP